MSHWKSRARAAGIHLGISALVAALAALLVFGVWYPFPYREVSGGRELFALVVSVDVVLGPLITFAIFNVAKSRRELRLDIAVVGLLQIAGLLYGLWTVQLARPVHLVFEFDRFRVVHNIDIPEQLLGQAPPGIDAVPWLGPTVLAVRPFRDAKESFDATMAALQGVPLAARPDLWRSYEASRAEVLAAAKPVDELKRRLPARAAEIDALLQRLQRDPAKTAYLPMVARKAQAWTVLVDTTSAGIVGYLPLDSF